MKTDNVIKSKTLDFAVRIMKLKRFLQENKEYDVSGQITRSGTAIGALVREAEYAESRLDFIHKLRVALKEANETSFWLEVLVRSNYLNKTMYDSMKYDNEELIKLLVSIINTSRKSSVNY